MVQELTFKIKLKSIARFLALLIILLLLGSLLGIYLKHGLHHDTVFGLVPMFDMDREQSIPTLFAFLFLLLNALLLFVIAQTVRISSKGGFYAWLGLSFIFLFLSLDEFVSIHERFTVLIRESLNLSGLLYFAWVIPYGLILILLTICYLPFFFKLPTYLRKKMIVAFIIFLLGAVCMEMLSGYYFEQNNQINDVAFDLMCSFEEVLELSGSALFIYALLSYLKFECSHISLRFDIDNQ